LLQFKLILWCK